MSLLGINSPAKSAIKLIDRLIDYKAKIDCSDYANLCIWEQAKKKVEDLPYFITIDHKTLIPEGLLPGREECCP